MSIKKVSYTHDGIIDVLIAEPLVTQEALARMFGYSTTWISKVINSDLFKARLGERKAELTDPVIVQSVEERLQAVAQRSLDVVLGKLEHSGMVDPDFALAAAAMSTKALGHGGAGPAARGPSVTINLPGVLSNAQAWAQRHSPPGAVEMVQEVPITRSTPPPVETDHEKMKVYL